MISTAPPSRPLTVKSAGAEQIIVLHPPHSLQSERMALSFCYITEDNRQIGPRMKSPLLFIMETLPRLSGEERQCALAAR